MATIDQIITNGKLSVPFSANYNAEKGAMNGGALAAPGSPILIAMVTDALTWMEEGGNYTEQERISVANYLVWLCGKFGLEAAAVTGSGGSVTPVTPSIPSNPLQLNFTVAAMGTYLINGQSTVTFDGSGGNPDFRGYNLQIVKNGTGLTQITTAPVYYTWNSITGVLVVVPTAFTGDEFQITPST